MDWQPIATAPKDGTVFPVLTKAGNLMLAYWSTANCWASGGIAMNEPVFWPVFWCDLPPAPTSRPFP